MGEEKISFSWIAKAVSDAMHISSVENPQVASLKKEGRRDLLKIIKKLPAKKQSFSEQERKLIDKYSEPGRGPVFYEAEGIVRCKEKKGESVAVTYVENSPDCMQITKEIQKLCWQRGCHALRMPASTKDLRTKYETAPDDALFEVPKLSLAMIKGTDVSIFVGDEEDLNWSKGIEGKLAFSARASKARYREYERAKVRSALLGIPVEGGGAVEKEKYFSVFYSTLKESFSDRMPKIVDYYEKSLKNKGTIRITAGDGTDLVFSIKGRELLRDDATPPKDKSVAEHYNFPAGELFVAPVETSAEGVIVFDYVMPRGFGLIRDLRLVFKKGKIAEFSASGDGADRFRKFLDANTGEKDRIGELGIGCNPAAEFIGTTIVDEKIYGSVHIAVGWNKGSFKGKNEASSHQDMVKIMKGRGGNMYADGQLVMKVGMPVSKV